MTKGELELVKERMAQAERKLWQAGIPLAPPPAKERPRATGPAAAERTREEGAAHNPPEASPMEGASREAAEAGEPIGAVEAEGMDTSEAEIPPVRRHAESGMEKKPV